MHASLCGGGDSLKALGSVAHYLADRSCNLSNDSKHLLHAFLLSFKAYSASVVAPLANGQRLRKRLLLTVPRPQRTRLTGMMSKAAMTAQNAASRKNEK
jgi:hypothetical protein